MKLYSIYYILLQHEFHLNIIVWTLFIQYFIGVNRPLLYFYLCIYFYHKLTLKTYSIKQINKVVITLKLWKMIEQHFITQNTLLYPSLQNSVCTSIWKKNV